MIVGIGIDIIEIDRIRKAIERWGSAFLEHVYTPGEIAFAEKYRFPYAHYAGRFAAKEAVYKALGQSRVSWQNLEIINDESGAPHCRCLLTGFTNTIRISISHSRDYAVAQAIVEV